MIEFYNDVVEGLSKKHKTLPSKYFYDEHGSHLFDLICELEEYYLTRTEIELLKEISEELSDIIRNKHLIEYGSGSSKKIKILLDSGSIIKSYVPIDISEKYLLEVCKNLNKEYPLLKINNICADFTKKIKFNKISEEPKIIFFPGSTIGNFSEIEITNFIRNTAEALKPNGEIIVGFDLFKNKKIIENAYNDSKGITKDFNLNILKRINNELSANFILENFKHDAIFCEDKSRLEMHLVSKLEQSVQVRDYLFKFNKGETIHTENSYKYKECELKNLFCNNGFTEGKIWKDKNNLFAIHHFISSL
ncbi:MAG: L-histidine N(alpha)-methyltransferase [Alphaproteobacteria bacterium TMED87]|nr:L-histidine N(alpha)-methyltransferase [Rhodospirillaceae bacterium]OUV08631.1 MAG: L-histidine N(alpha)-methyltransferase [Alphaproteobacteria bacterium TMED87]